MWISNESFKYWVIFYFKNNFNLSINFFLKNRFGIPLIGKSKEDYKIKIKISDLMNFEKAAKEEALRYNIFEFNNEVETDIKNNFIDFTFQKTEQEKYKYFEELIKNQLKSYFIENLTVSSIGKVDSENKIQILCDSFNSLEIYVADQEEKEVNEKKKLSTAEIENRKSDYDAEDDEEKTNDINIENIWSLNNESNIKRILIEGNGGVG